MDWPQISRQVNDILQATPVDDFEQGYWVDLNQALPPGKISFDIGSLKRDLPEEFRSGLNWSPDKKFFFLVSVLSPRPSPAILADDLESDLTIQQTMKLRQRRKTGFGRVCRRAAGNAGQGSRGAGGGAQLRGRHLALAEIFRRHPPRCKRNPNHPLLQFYPRGIARAGGRPLGF